MDTFRAAVKGNVDIKKQQMVKIVEVSHSDPVDDLGHFASSG